MKQVKNNWYQSSVLYGSKQGRTIGFPTINLDAAVLPKSQKEGVFAANIKHKSKSYKAALFYGPRVFLGESHRVLELYILDFSKDLYNKTIEFQILDFIREVKNFSSVEEMKKQIEEDVEKILALL